MAPRGKLTYQFSRTIPTKLELQNILSVILITTSAEEVETSVTSYGGFLDFFLMSKSHSYFPNKKQWPKVMATNFDHEKWSIASTIYNTEFIN